MFKSSPFGVAVAGMIAAVALSACQSGSVGSPSRASDPTPAPTIASTPEATPTPTEASPPAPTQVFESARFGLSIGYPEGWKATAGRVPWKMDDGGYLEPLGDLIEDPSHEFLWVKLASLPIGKMPFDEWAGKVFAGHGCDGYRLQVEIDEVKGLLDFACHTALVARDGRGYLIGAHLCPCELGSLQEWDAWFNTLLTTVRLEPERAID